MLRHYLIISKGESKWRINLVMVIGISTPLSPIYFSYIVMANFIGGGTENNQRMSLTNLYLPTIPNHIIRPHLETGVKKPYLRRNIYTSNT
jgi:hypothetical protein